MQKHFTLIALLLIVLTISIQAASAQELSTIELPAPNKTGGMPLMQALAERSSSRSFAPKELSTETLSDLLWAAFGINREDGRRTAPSAMNWQEVDIYVALKKGCYRYDAETHRLEPVVAKDLRALSGQQDYVGSAPLNLIYVADISKMSADMDEATLVTIANADTGFIGQNVYLYCASEGLVTVVRGLIDHEALRAELPLRPEQRIILAQSIGYSGD